MSMVQVLSDLPSVAKMAAAKNLKRFLDKHDPRAFRLVSYAIMINASVNSTYMSNSIGCQKSFCQNYKLMCFKDDVFSTDSWLVMTA